MPVSKRQRDSASTWTFKFRLPADVPVHRAGRFVARVLKYLLRTWGVKCVAVRDNPPADRVTA
jgi:hypothetical protein